MLVAEQLTVGTLLRVRKVAVQSPVLHIAEAAHQDRVQFEETLDIFSIHLRALMSRALLQRTQATNISFVGILIYTRSLFVYALDTTTGSSSCFQLVFGQHFWVLGVVHSTPDSVRYPYTL